MGGVMGWDVRLRSVRESRGLSRRAVATGTGLTELTVSNAERGCEVTLRTALLLSRYYGEPVESLWEVVLGDE